MNINKNKLTNFLKMVELTFNQYKNKGEFFFDCKYGKDWHEINYLIFEVKGENFNFCHKFYIQQKISKYAETSVSRINYIFRNQEYKLADIKFKKNIFSVTFIQKNVGITIKKIVDIDKFSIPLKNFN